MRYTTTIDVTELPAIWRNHNATRLYFYLAMKCGYHDNDRDLIRISYRVLAMESGLTLSATRHALKMLKAAQLITTDGDALRIKKFIIDVKPTARTQKNTAQQNEAERRLLQQEQEERRRVYENYLKTAPLDELRTIKERLDNGHRTQAHGLIFAPSQALTQRLEYAIDERERREILKKLSLEKLKKLASDIVHDDLKIGGKIFSKTRSFDKILIQQAINEAT